ncbi:MAG: hypothetical protein KC502_16740 [Myxococcales bacterium]|nr:hypothetical protein [Myxococcales bacterium]
MGSMASFARATFCVAALVLAVGCGSDKDAVAGTDGGATDGVGDALFGSGNGQCTDCAKDSDCGAGLTCDKPAFVCKTPKQVKAKKPVCAVDCEESTDCAEKGLCGLYAGTCRAETLADCLVSTVCKKTGHCTAKDSVCAVVTDGDCQKADICSQDGKCRADGGECKLPKEAPKCGDGTCAPGESKASCPADCGPVGGEACACAKGECGVKTGCPNDCGGCEGDAACFSHVCKVAQCELPKTFPGGVQRLTSLKLLTHKQGCDLDDSGTPDNVLGKLFKVYNFVNDGAELALSGGKLNLLLHAAAFDASGKAFALNVLDADQGSNAKTCDLKSADVKKSCAFVVRAQSFDGAAKSAVCPALSQFTGATVKGGKLSAGGPDRELHLYVYVVGVPLDLRIRHAMISGTVTGGTSWGATTSGQICGAIRMKDVDDAVDALSDSALLGTGFDQKSVKKLVADLFGPDIDTDGDNKPDAISAAWSFTTLPVQVEGVK